MHGYVHGNRNHMELLAVAVGYDLLFRYKIRLDYYFDSRD
jgi:hypothetical protein